MAGIVFQDVDGSCYPLTEDSLRVLSVKLLEEQRHHVLWEALQSVNRLNKQPHYLHIVHKVAEAAKSTRTTKRDFARCLHARFDENDALHDFMRAFSAPVFVRVASHVFYTEVTRLDDEVRSALVADLDATLENILMTKAPQKPGSFYMIRLHEACCAEARFDQEWHDCIQRWRSRETTTSMNVEEVAGPSITRIRLITPPLPA